MLLYLTLKSFWDLSSFASQVYALTKYKWTGWLHLTSLHTHILIILLFPQKVMMDTTHKKFGLTWTKETKKREWQTSVFLSTIGFSPLHQGNPTNLFFVKIEVMHLVSSIICRPQWCSCMLHLQLVDQLQCNKST